MLSLSKLIINLFLFTENLLLLGLAIELLCTLATATGALGIVTMLRVHHTINTIGKAMFARRFGNRPVS